MNPNLVVPSFTYKDLLLKKLSHSVVCSVFSQLLILQLFVFLSNFNVLHPISSISSTLKIFTSITTWIFVLPFLTVLFAQSMICAKDYIFKSTYSSTRFQKFISVFTIHNLIMLILNTIVGVTLIWLLLTLGGGRYNHLTIKRKEDNYCLNDAAFYILLSGFWNGFYYFVKVHMSEKHLVFPVIHQRKLLQFKSQALNLLKNSFTVSFAPTVYYIVFFYLWGDVFTHTFAGFFDLQKGDDDSSVLIFMYLWILGAIYYFNMNLMRFFFNLFLTEPVEFPICKLTEDSLYLQTSINMSSLPIVQNLACLDLFNLAHWSKLRRQVFFTLSQPGGHPHNWNSLVENVLKLLSEYSDLLSKSTESVEAVSKPVAPLIQSPFQSPERFRNLRNMSLSVTSPSEPRDVNLMEKDPTTLPIFTLPEKLFGKLKQKIKDIVSVIKVVLGINFLFGELPQANIQKFLSNGYIIIWMSQGISELLCASLTEDRFGIAQKDLPGIITALVRLKQNLDKLNKVPALTRKIVGYEDFYFKMKAAVTVAVKRSLFNICMSFGKYFTDLPLKKDVLSYLQTNYKC